MGRIVVGVDGSESSRRALRWAADEATLRGDTLEAVLVYHPPTLPSYYAAFAVEAGVPPVTEEDEAFARDRARAALEHALDSIEDRAQRDAVERTVIGEYNIAEALIRLSKEADLLVVGSRGLGGFRGLMLGSISTKAVQHAECAVVVVHDYDHE